jgi:hypothetical protein
MLTRRDGEHSVPGTVSVIIPAYNAAPFFGETIKSVLAQLKAQVFRSLGGFRLPPGTEDWELWMRVAEEHRIAACHEPLVADRFHNGMLSGNRKKIQRGRQLAIESALSLKRGRALPSATKRRVLSATVNTYASHAARRGATAARATVLHRALALAARRHHLPKSRKARA